MTSSAAPTSTGRPARRFDWQKLLAPAVLVALYAFFAIFSRNFFTLDALVNILNASYFIGFMAIGVTFVIITGGIDLSLGTTMICAALLGAMAHSSWGWPVWAGLCLSVFVGLVIGTLNGLMIAYLKLPPFIATLGTQMMGMGFGAICTKVMTMRFPTYGSPDGLFKYIFYKSSASSALPGFPVGSLWLAGAFGVAWVVLNRTKFGRYTYAMGSNYEATRLSGVKTRRYLMMVYALCGLCSGFAAIFYGAVYTTIIPSTGNGLEMLGIAGVVIGGTSMSGGTGTLIGTLIGMFVMSVLKQGLMLMGLQQHWQTFLTGAVVVGAVLLDNYRVSRSNRV
ncbi:MAG: ABC transporter permease [Oscillospiraceae bacterium]|jgi:ribose transport system permease protein|nr:ABC transporter permease [Oscillospiraceae bacterium]